MNTGLHISLAAERVGNLLGLPLTNTLLAAWLAIALLVAAAFFVGRNASIIPNKLQNLFEMLFEYVLGYMESTLGTRELALRFFPLIATIFLFIFTANLLDFMPFVGSVGVWRGGELIPLLRPANTDLNMTLALAVIAFVVIEISGVAALGVLKYGSKFVSFKGGVMGFMVGLLELIGNVARLISFSFRLFGNVFAGEVLIAVVLSFLPLVLPVPLMLFEIFVGFLQAAIFALLTLVFVKLSIMEPHIAHGAENSNHKIQISNKTHV